MSGLNSEYDVIVIGGGLNGLACAAYLQKAGQKVAVFERREEVGAHCTTEVLMAPGLKMNLHATFLLPHLGPATEELELERFGFEPVTSSEWACMHPFRDGTAFLRHISDARKEYEAWKRISPRDAEQYRRMINYLGTIWPDFLQLSVATIPTVETLSEFGEMISKTPGMPRDWRDMNGFQVIDELFESDKVKAGLLALATAQGVVPWHRGVSAFAPILGLAGGFGSWHARGGSHALAHAVSRCFVHYGGALFQGCPVVKIDVEAGEAKGVFLSRDAVYPEAHVRAGKAVVSDLTCYPTFIQLVGEDKLPPEVATAARAYDYNGQTLFTNYWALSEPAQWRSADGFPEVSDAFNFLFGVETPADLMRLAVDEMVDRPSDPPIAAGGCCQGYVQADPTQAPHGQFTLMTWSNVPYDIRPLGGPEKWDDIREEYGDKVEDLLAEYMPNLKRAKIARYVMTPLDIYRRNPSAIKGSWSGGNVSPTQFWHNRPFAGCGAPRTPIGKLYISNSIWPYSDSWLCCGGVAAQAVAEDLGVRNQDWWRHKSLDAYPRMCAKYGFEWHPTVD